MRTIIDLTAEQLDALALICHQERLSRAEAIRRAVSLYIQRHRASDKDDAFGMWRDRHVDGLSYQRRRRKEWPS